MQLPYEFEEETEYFEFIPASFTDEMVSCISEVILEHSENFQSKLAQSLHHIPSIQVEQIKENNVNGESVEAELQSKRNYLASLEKYQTILEREIENEEKCTDNLQLIWKKIQQLTSACDLNGSFTSNAEHFTTQMEALRNIVCNTMKAFENQPKSFVDANSESLQEFNMLLQQKEISQMKLKEEKQSLYNICDPDVLAMLKSISSATDPVA